jgi:cyclophilin family peptidyl-prolyl cis-trans isomerase
VANLEKPLTRAGVFLADGLYADITTSSGTRIMTTLDYEHAPLHVANFVRIVEGREPQPAGGGGRAAGPPPGVGPGGPGGRGGAGGERPPEPPPIGKIVDLKGGLANAVVVSAVQKSVAVPKLPRAANPALKHDVEGVLGVSGPNTFYLTLQKNNALDRRYTAIGKVIAGLGLLQNLKAGEGIRSVRIVRAGQAARDFKTDDEAFKKLLEQAAKKR